jgi:hypothetical protein
MACVAFAWAAWINLIDFFSPLRAVPRVQTKAPGYEADRELEVPELALPQTERLCLLLMKISRSKHHNATQENKYTSHEVELGFIFEAVPSFATKLKRSNQKRNKI